MRPLVLPTLALSVLLAGCGTVSRPEPGEGPRVGHLSLTQAQFQAVEGGVGNMVANPEGARFSATTAVSVPGDPGIHVCGYVSFKGETGRHGEALPYYLELRDVGGKPVPERGQVGSDPAKLAKVEFMCRRNEPG